MTVTDDTFSGEQRHRSRRKSFWIYLTVVMTLALIGSTIVGFFAGWSEIGDLPLWVPVIGWAVLMAAWLWFTRDYFRRVDELDLLDNLWAHLIGFYGLLGSFGTWWFLASVGITREPNAMAVVVVGMVVTFAAYGLRKLGWR